MINIVVFASGSGTNFQSIIDATEKGQIKGQIRGLITNKTEIKAVERAKDHDIEHRYMAPSDFSDSMQYENALLDQLGKWNTDLIALAGYMIKVPAAVVQTYKKRIVNIHPSLLPKYGGRGFFGSKVHQAVIENEESESGCTVHLVTEVYDDGPILGQRKVPVHASDDPQSLADRILEQEHQLFPEVIAKLANDLNIKSNKK